MEKPGMWCLYILSTVGRGCELTVWLLFAFVNVSQPGVIQENRGLVEQLPPSYCPMFEDIFLIDDHCVRGQSTVDATTPV